MVKNKNNTSVRRIITCCMAVSAILFSCSTVRNVSYLQDIQPEVPLNIQETQQITLQPGDRLRITVFSRDRDLSDLFNLYDHSTSGGSSTYHPYTVSANGTVEMPTLGMIRVQGLTRQQAADEIKYQLLASRLLLDPTVIVEYYDMSFYALGEVNSPGRI